MCEQTPIDYKDGDIVWVKLGPCWWPGEVRELSKLPPDWLADFKKPPIAAVKFFDEDAYEYVKSIDKIYSYNCTKKNDFIKKGLDLYRAKNSFMDKFPADVRTAEERTNGDPEIVDSPIFTPEKKPNFTQMIFGSASKPKKTPKKSMGGSGGGARRQSSSLLNTPSSSKSPTSRVITHPRFLGQDDHEVRILVQTSDKPAFQDQENESVYNCTSCGFTTTRIDVIVSHNKSHIQGVYSTPTSTLKKPRKSSPKKGKKLKMTRSKTSSLVEDLALIDKGVLLNTESSDEDVLETEQDEPKRKRKRNKRKPKKAPPKKEMESKVDIRNNLLAEWDDSEEEEEEAEKSLNTSLESVSEKLEEAYTSTLSDKLEESYNTSTTEPTKSEESEQASDVKEDDKKCTIDKSCFDFEEEEEENEVIGTSVGRKIPRVIPPTEKPKMTDPELSQASLPIAEDDITRTEQIREVSETSKEPEQAQDLHEDAFKDILEATAVPELPEVPHSLKCEQNFHNAKTIKFPDKEENKIEPLKDEMATKLINPKKRFVKSFEDFEQQFNEQKKHELEEQRRLEEEKKLAEEKKREEQKRSELEEQKRIEEQQRLEEERKKLELEEQRTIEEEKERRIEEEEEEQRRIEEEKRRLKLEEQKRLEEEHIKLQEQRRLEEQEEEEEQRRLEEEHRTLEEEQRRSAEEQRKLVEEEKRRLAEEEQRRLAEEEQKLAEEEEQKRLAEEEEQKRLVEEEQKRLAEEEKQRRLEEEQTKLEEQKKLKQQKKLEEKQRKLELEEERKLEEQRKLDLEQTNNLHKNKSEETDTKVRDCGSKDNSSVCKEQDVDVNKTSGHNIESIRSVEKNKYKPETSSDAFALSEEKSKSILESSSGKVEVSKLKTQLMSKLENAEKYLDPSRKRVESPKQSRFKDEDSWLYKKPRMSLASRSPTKEKIHELSEFKPLENEKLEKHSNNDSEIIKPVKPRRLSVKVSEVIEAHEVELMAEAFVEEMPVEQAMLLEQVSESKEETQIEEIVTDVPTTELQIPNFEKAVEICNNKSIEETEKSDEPKVVEEVVVENSDDINKIHINSVADKNEDLSALSTLAAVSELTTNLDIEGKNYDEKSKIIEGSLANVSSSLYMNNERPKIEGGVTFVSEQDLAEGQVEIASGDGKDKPITLSNFSVDFSDPNQKEESFESETIERSLEKVFKEDSPPEKDKLNTHSSACDIEDQIPSLIITSKESENKDEYSSSSKLLEILTDGKPKTSKDLLSPKSDVPSRKTETKISKELKTIPKLESKNTKILSTYSGASSGTKSKAIILSEKIIKPVSEIESVSVQKVTSKRSNQDIEDIDTFIIQKPTKKILMSLDENDEVVTPIKKMPVSRGKAKILQQTIIKPAEPTPTTVQDDNMFDINAMPIVLGDQILTAESIENMPVVLSDTVSSVPKTTPVTTATISKPHLLNKVPTPVTTQSVMVKTYPSQKIKGPTKVFSPNAPKIVKSNPAIISRTGKSDKFIIVPSTSNTPTSSKYTVGKRPIVKRSSPVVLPANTAKIPTTSEPTGNKIMIVTNQHGRQSRVLLTPAQQKLLGYQTSGSKLVKSTLKGNLLQKATSNIKQTPPKVQNLISHAIVNSKGQIIGTSNQITSDTPLLMPVKQQVRPMKPEITKGRKVQMQGQKVLLQESLSALKSSPGQQKTIVIKNQQGQIVKKIQGTDDALLEQQVAEQVQAIKASGSFAAALKSKQEAANKMKHIVKRSYPKKPQFTSSNKAMSFATPKMQKTETSIPPLAPISPKKSEILIPQTDTKTETVQQKPLNQLVIQDALGNQTTITEGQILALPSGETVDGQPQSYMLVTLDESGNLTPLNNEALLSLDPNLCLAGDLSNMVLQIDEGNNASANQESNETKEEAPQEPPKEVPPTPIVVPPQETQKVENSSPEVPQQNLEGVQVTCSIGSDPNQQLIITGDPISAQKFIESLAEGNSDLANILASAEGNILIQTDEQQILINTDADNQVLLPVNSENVSEGDSNPIFATQPKNQDILAAALADTDVFQQDQTISLTQTKVSQSQLSPNSGLYPSGVSNVLGTTLSLSSPIMTPLEVPSSNSKKIPDEESDILTTEVPKNVDLPITITDPNISQTVAHQQVASLIASELTNNLDLPLSISDQGVPLTSAEMNSPSYVYSLPSLDESVDIHPKTFSGPISMPLLNEEPPADETKVETSESKDESSDSPSVNQLFDNNAEQSSSRSFLGTTIETEEGLCTLGGAMCSSLSEPPPDMFDLSVVNSAYASEASIKNIDADIPDAVIDPSVSESTSVPCESKEDNLDTNTNENKEEDYDKYDNFDAESRNDSTPLSSLPVNSESSSPAVNIDENSCEIPVQPQIVTDLSSSSFETQETADSSDFESNKRTADEIGENEKKKIKFD